MSLQFMRILKFYPQLSSPRHSDTGFWLQPVSGSAEPQMLDMHRTSFTLTSAGLGLNKLAHHQESGARCSFLCKHLNLSAFRSKNLSEPEPAAMQTRAQHKLSPAGLSPVCDDHIPACSFTGRSGGRLPARGEGGGWKSGGRGECCREVSACWRRRGAAHAHQSNDD